MCLHILADLHLEFGAADIPSPEADVVVLDGDVDVGAKGLAWIRSQFPNRPVVYILGNHEFYRHNVTALTESLRREAEGSHVFNMPELKEALGTSVTYTVLRKLAPLDYRSSYSHGGTYYTLDRIARYDELGLWFHRDIRFSRYGTLLNTAEALVNKAPGGLPADLLRIEDRPVLQPRLLSAPAPWLV